MEKVAIIRCEKNENTCPMTSCLQSLREKREGFAGYEDPQLVGLLTCRCPGENAVEFARILKDKGADTVHFCTCTFANKTDQGWSQEGGGFCDHIDPLVEKIHKEVEIRCVKGTAHLPRGYTPQVWG